MIEGAEQVIEEAPDGIRFDAIGVAVPGVIDMLRGRSIFLPNLPGDWPNVAVTPPIQEALGKPAYLINDVRAFTLAELTLGAAQGIHTGIFYAVGTGIGGGIVAHGQVNLGIGGAGGELGHLIVDPNGPECGCGNRGCAEAYAAGPALIGEANRRIVMGETTILREMIGEDLNKMVPELVEQAAGEGDAIACEVLDYAGFHFGLAFAGAIAALAPEVVVLGGGVVKPHGYFWQQIEKSAREHSHVTDIDRIEFRAASYSYEAGVVGAALWSREVTAGRATPAP
jgi:glucokinase